MFRARHPATLLRASAVALLAALSACAPAADPAAAPADRAPVTAPPAPALQALIDAALDDAARRTKLEASKLKVISVEAVTWPDGSLGCPQPGMLYTQALVPGYRIRIGAGGEVLDYHAGTRGSLVLCPSGRSVAPASGGPT
jgi:hypothetical protein